MSRLGLDRFRLGVVILAVISPGPAFGQPYRAAPAALVPAQFNTKHDALGFQWQVNSYGGIERGTNYCFNTAQRLRVNNSQFSANQVMMTADGNEYVLTRTMSGVLTTRRVKIDLKTGTARYVETFHNPATAAVTLNVRLTTHLQNSVRSVLTDRGTPAARAGGGLLGIRSPFAGPSPGQNAIVLGKKDSGLVAIQSSSSRPSVLFYLAAAQSKVKPTTTHQGNEFYFNYSVTVPPKKTVSLLHGLAQRNIRGATDAKSLAKQFKPFQSREWTRDLPAEVRKSIINGGRTYASYGEEAPGGPLLQAVMNLADYWDAERGPKAVLIQDEDTRLAGVLSGQDLTVDTRYGQTTVPLEDVAVLVGGAGVGRSMQVYLRNGEILVGSVESKEMALAVESGLEVKLSAEDVNVLFARVDPAEGKPSPEAAVLLQTRLGDRLALAEMADVKLQAATAWGTLQVSMEDVERLYSARTPHPIHRLLLKDKSRLSVILHGSDLAVSTLRFGSVKVAPGVVTELTNLHSAAAAKDEDAGEETELKVPHHVLLGNNIVVGTLDAAELEVVTAAGITSVDTRLLRVMERNDDERAEPTFTFELADESQLVGGLREVTLPVRICGKVFAVPTHHVVSYRQPKEEPPEEAEPTSPDEKKPEPDEKKPEPDEKKPKPDEKKPDEKTRPATEPKPEPKPEPPDDPFKGAEDPFK